MVLLLLGIIIMSMRRSNFGEVLRGRFEPVIVSMLGKMNRLAIKESHMLR